MFSDSPANKRPNVFVNVLQPTQPGSAKSQILQAEVHYRNTVEFTRFTVLLNNMRLMGIFDWFVSVHEFINTSADNPYSSSKQYFHTQYFPCHSDAS